MKNPTLLVHDYMTNSSALVLIPRVTHLTKGWKGNEDLTIIHLENGAEIITTDSLKSLHARIDFFLERV